MCQQHAGIGCLAKIEKFKELGRRQVFFPNLLFKAKLFQEKIHQVWKKRHKRLSLSVIWIADIFHMLSSTPQGKRQKMWTLCPNYPDILKEQEWSIRRAESQSLALVVFQWKCDDKAQKKQNNRKSRQRRVWVRLAFKKYILCSVLKALALEVVIVGWLSQSS